MAKVEKIDGFDVVGHVVKVPMSKIDGTNWNPPSRTDPKSKELKKLAHSMEQHGQLVPVQLWWNADKTRLNLSEGNRRCAAAKMNNAEFINAIVKDHAPPADYAEINEHCSKHDQAQKLYSYLRENNSVGEWFSKRFSGMIDVIGRESAEKMVLKGKGHTFYVKARAYAKWIELPKGDYKAFVNYLLDVPDAETNVRKLKEKTDLTGDPSPAARMLEIRQAFDQLRTPNCHFGANRIEARMSVAVN